MSRRTLPLLLVLIVVGAALGMRGESRDLAPDPVGDPAGSPSLERAEALFAEGSYALALEVYRDLAEKPPEGVDPRWIAFRIADATWRSAAATQRADTEEIDRARQALEVLIRDVRRDEDRDPLWVEVQESLGDLHWLWPQGRNWSEAWPHYQAALEWWARSTSIEEARERYLGIVWKASEPPQAGRWYVYGNFGNQLPLNVLQNAETIAVDPGDRAHASYLLAMTLRHQSGDPARHTRTREAFRSAIGAGRGSD